MVTSEAQEIKKQETLVRFSIISYKTRLRVLDRFQFNQFLDSRSEIHQIFELAFWKI